MLCVSFGYKQSFLYLGKSGKNLDQKCHFWPGQKCKELVVHSRIV